VAGLPEHRIRVVSPDIGGGFGNKMPVYPGYLCEIVGSMVTGRPVKWTEDRSENLMSTGFTRDYVMTGAMAATREGKVLGVRVEVIADHGAFNTTAQPTNYPRHSCPSASRPRDRAMRRPSPRSSPIAWHPPRGRRRGARRH
jgi:carbon-monoxide dehydrogenase large subunit